MRLLTPIPESADSTQSSINIDRLISAPPPLITPSTTVHAADISMPVTSKILLSSSCPKVKIDRSFRIKFAGDQVEVPGGGVVERLQQVLPISTGLY